MNTRQLIVTWVMGILLILVTLIFSYDYRYFWVGLSFLWAILIIGGSLIYIFRERREITIETCVNIYLMRLRVILGLRIIADVFLLSVPVFIVKLMIKDIKSCMRRLKG